jgi:hypothetical protein
VIPKKAAGICAGLILSRYRPVGKWTKSRLGPKQAIVATAHKIARTVYHLLKTHEPYQEESAPEYDRKRREREVKQLARRAQKLGYTLTAVPDRTPESQPEPGN